MLLSVKTYFDVRKHPHDCYILPKLHTLGSKVDPSSLSQNAHFQDGGCDVMKGRGVDWSVEAKVHSSSVTLLATPLNRGTFVNFPEK